MGLMNQKIYCQAITNIHGILKLWSVRYLTLLTVIPIHITVEVQKKQKYFIWDDSSPKIKHETLKMEFKARGLNNVDIRFKFFSLHYS